jgi:hypothetical protein
LTAESRACVISDWLWSASHRTFDDEHMYACMHHMHHNICMHVCIICIITYVCIRVAWWVCEKIAPKEGQHIFCQNVCITCTVEKCSPNIWAISVIFIKLHKVNNDQIGMRKFARSGVDVMITIFCDFRQFSAKASSSLSKKLQYFRKILRLKYFKSHSIGPWSPWYVVTAPPTLLSRSCD